MDVKKHEQIVEDLKLEQKYELKELEQKHSLELKEKEFELKHFKDDSIQKLELQIVNLTKDKAVLEEKVKMLDKIVDLNADIVDVKKLVNTLIEKIPTFDLKSLTINQTGNK